MNKMNEFSQELSYPCADRSNGKIAIVISSWCPCLCTDELAQVNVSPGFLSAEVFALSLLPNTSNCRRSSLVTESPPGVPECWTQWSLWAPSNTGLRTFYDLWSFLPGPAQMGGTIFYGGNAHVQSHCFRLSGRGVWTPFSKCLYHQCYRYFFSVLLDTWLLLIPGGIFWPNCLNPRDLSVWRLRCISAKFVTG